MSDIYMRIMLAANAGNALGVIQSVGKALSGSGGLGGALATVGVAAVAAGAAIAGTALKMAGDYQSSLAQLVTGAGESASAIGMVGDSILKMSVDTGTSTSQLVAGMFQIDSAGYTAAKGGLNVLQVAAEGARVQNADLGTVANALTGILHNYHLSASQAAGTMNALVQTTKDGKLHLQDLASAMGAILPTASALGVSYPQVGAAIAEMTNANTTAQQAAQNLSHTLLALSAPNATAEKSMKAVGLTAQQVKDALSQQGLSGALQLVENAVGKKFPAGSVQSVQALKNILGGVTGYRTALQLSGPNMTEFQKNAAGIAAVMNKGGSSVNGWSTIQGTFNFKMAQAGQAVNAFMIKLGEKLLPVATQLVGFFVSNFLPTLSTLGTWLGNVANFFEKNQTAMNALKAVLIAAGVVIATAVIPALIGMAIEMGVIAVETLIATAPFILAGIIIAAVVFGIIEAVQHLGQIMTWLKNLWATVSSWIGQQFSRLGGFIHLQIQIIGMAFSMLGTWVHNALTFVGNLFSQFGTGVHDVITNVITWFQNLPGQVVTWITSLVSQGEKLFTNFWTNIVSSAKNIFGTLSSAISGILKGAINTAIIDPLDFIIQKIDSIHVSTPFGNVGFSIPQIPKLATGGMLTTGGLVTLGERGAETVALPAGAAVYPHGSVPAGYGGGGPTYYITINLSTMARSQGEVRRVVDLVEQELGRRMRAQTPSYSSGGIY